jgi:hypothetical protein
VFGCELELITAIDVLGKESKLDKLTPVRRPEFLVSGRVTTT